jgi:hypothetical protein
MSDDNGAVEKKKKAKSEHQGAMRTPPLLLPLFTIAIVVTPCLHP